MNATNLINTIKRMLTDKLTASEREQLLNEKPMIPAMGKSSQKPLGRKCIFTNHTP